jgi:beta-lactamase class A
VLSYQRTASAAKVPHPGLLQVVLWPIVTPPDEGAGSRQEIREPLGPSTSAGPLVFIDGQTRQCLALAPFLLPLPTVSRIMRRPSSPTIPGVKPAGIPGLGRAVALLALPVLGWAAFLPAAQPLGALQDATGGGGGFEPAFREAFPELRRALEVRIAEHRGVVGVVVLDPRTGEGVSIRGDEPFPTASMIKIPILYELFLRVEEGDLGLDDPLSMLAGDRAPGAGILRYFEAPAPISVRNAALLMTALSDNTATNLLIAKVGARAVTDRMAAEGFPQTQLFRRVFATAAESFDPEGSERWGFGVTTPMELARILARIERGEAVTPEASEEMLRMLEAQQHRVGIPRLLPPGTRVAHKTGTISAARHDCGIVYAEARSFVLCVMTQENEDTRTAWDNEAEMLQGELARIVFDALGSG